VSSDCALLDERRDPPLALTQVEYSPVHRCVRDRAHFGVVYISIAIPSIRAQRFESTAMWMQQMNTCDEFQPR